MVVCSSPVAVSVVLDDELLPTNFIREATNFSKSNRNEGQNERVI